VKDLRDTADGAILGSDAPSQPTRLTSEDGEGVLVTRIAEGDASSNGNLEGVDLLLGDVEGDGHGEEGTIGETEGRENAANKSG
jgi:hypothetical protein